MNIWIVLSLNLIYQISAIEIYGKYFKIVNGIKANLNVTLVYEARSVEECATQCSSAEGCAHANFYDSYCEFLDYVPGRGDIELVEEQASQYIYSELECQNGGRCVLTESGVQCQCLPGYAGVLCQKAVEECAFVYNAKCFVVVMERLTWYDARDNCTGQGGKLPEICEPYLNDRLLQVSFESGNIGFWIGGSDEQNEGQWEWTTGKCAWEWSDWGQLYGGGIYQNCIYIHFDHHWNDSECSRELNFICEL